jgi:hypothetical protein
VAVAVVEFVLAGILLSIGVPRFVKRRRSPSWSGLPPGPYYELGGYVGLSVLLIIAGISRVVNS